MFSLKSTKQIFSKAAASANLKLDSQLMQTLFDQMLMGFKYQVQLAVQPEDIYFATLQHLAAVRALVEGDSAIYFVDAARNRLQTMCATFSAYDFCVVRQQTCKFLADLHVPVA